MTIKSCSYKQHNFGSATDPKTTILYVRNNVGESRPKTGVLETYFSAG